MDYVYIPPWYALGIVSIHIYLGVMLLRQLCHSSQITCICCCGKKTTQLQTRGFGILDSSPHLETDSVDPIRMWKPEDGVRPRS